MQEFQVNKSNPSQSRIVDTTIPTMADGQVLVNIDRFAFTSNNITYAVAGDMLKYWQFFPVNQDADSWGVIPVWGFADVVESNLEALPVGERLFGYFPPTRKLVMTPTRVNTTTFIEGSEHRAELPAGYNMYRRVNAEQGYTRDADNSRMLLGVLYMTGFCLHDLLNSNDWYGSEQIIVLSSSSKTSIGLAYALDQDPTAPTTIGLTSPNNVATVLSLDVYDQAYGYDNLDAIDTNKPTTIVDMSGNPELLQGLHRRLNDNMQRTINVGLTHWDQPRTRAGIIVQRSEQFFAPSYIQKLIAQWGFEKYEKNSHAFFQGAAERSRAWLNINEVDGLDGLTQTYPAICNGKLPADTGLVVVM